MRLFTLCSYLKTKESYDRWVTGRLWGFRQQISKAKYLKKSVGNIRKLQENTAALYTEKKTLRVSANRSGYVWPDKLKRPPLPSGCQALDVKYPEKDPDMFDRGSWNVFLSHLAVRYPDVKCRRTEFRMWNIRRRWNVGRIEFLPGWNELFHASQGGPSACPRCRDPSPWWHGARKAIRINSIRIPQEDMWRAPLSRLPQGEAHGTREHHT